MLGGEQKIKKLGQNFSHKISTVEVCAMCHLAIVFLQVFTSFPFPSTQLSCLTFVELELGFPPNLLKIGM